MHLLPPGPPQCRRCPLSVPINYPTPPPQKTAPPAVLLASNNNIINDLQIIAMYHSVNLTPEKHAFFAEK